tara:strand:+ start:437 stop:634 length:198 start_codon:yes stop_codon:yes gene_type:complete
MTTKLVAVCDHGNCKAQTEVQLDKRAMDNKGWGTISLFGVKDFCPIHWPQYCKENDINPESGQYN